MNHIRTVLTRPGGPLHLSRRCLLAGLLVLLTAVAVRAESPKEEVKHYLYVGAPGIRNDLEYGGAGILVFDMDNGHKFVKRIETPASREQKPDNIKGVCANAATKKLYFTTTKKLYCVDLVTEKTLWEKALPQGCDRMSMTPDGKMLYVPSFEKDTWNVVDGPQRRGVGDHRDRRAAPTIPSSASTAQRMYLAGLRSPLLSVADTQTHKIVKTVGPFAAAIRPVHGQRGPDALLRHRQRPARLRDRRSEDRQEVVPRRDAGRREGAGQAARLPKPRHRPDAGREGTLGVRRP